MIVITIYNCFRISDDNGSYTREITHDFMQRYIDNDNDRYVGQIIYRITCTAVKHFQCLI